MNAVATPHSMEAERKTLAAMMRDKSAVVKARDILTGDDFFQPAHREIFLALCDMATRGAFEDITVLADVLEKIGKLEEIGGAGELMQIAGCVATSVSVEHHAQIVQEKSIRRQVIRNANQQAKEAVNGDLDALSAKAYQDALEIIPPSKTTGFRRIDQFLDMTVETIQERMKRRSSGKSFKDVASGIHDLDWKTGGFNRGELVILAARPSEGKTLLGTQIALNIAESGNVGYVSCEMDGSEILGRTFACQKGNNDSETARMVLRKANDLQRLNLYFDDSPGIRIDQLAARSERLKIEIGNIDLLVIDYLQLLRVPPDMARNRLIEKVTFLSGECKALARRLDCPILLLSQLSRDCEKENRKPRLSDLRESGSIEQDADMVIFIHRPEGIERGQSGIRELLIQKNRNGITGEAQLIFDSETLSFYGLTDRDIPDEAVNW